MADGSSKHDQFKSSKNSQLLVAKDLRVSFILRGRRIAAVEGLDLKLSRGKILAIVGESGAGKTQICRALLGILPASAVVSGSVLFEGNELMGLSEREMRAYRGNQISMIFQDPERSLNPIMKVGRQIAESVGLNDKASGRTVRARIGELMSRLEFSRPNNVFDLYPHQLSGGMQQKIMIAIALARRPKLLIADEVTRSLDAIGQARVIQLLMDMRSELGMAIIMITHDLTLAATIADDVLLMQMGRPVAFGSARALLGGPAVRLRGLPVVATLNADHAMSPAIVGSSVLGSCHSVQTPRIRAPLLRVRGVVQEYGIPGYTTYHRPTVRAVAGVSFDLYAGEAFGIVGETGSGKSTLARTLLQEPPPKSGSISLNGVDLTTLSKRGLSMQRREIQMVFQDAYMSINPKWTVYSVIEESLIGLPDIKRGDRQRRVWEALDLVGLSQTQFARRRAWTLSGGQCQRVAIARAIASRPSLIILDEPLSSLDELTQVRILELLGRLRDDLQIALLLISHDLSHVVHLCKRIAVMHMGSVCEIGAAQMVYDSPAHPYTNAIVKARPNLDRGLSPMQSLPINGREHDHRMSKTGGCGFRPRCPRGSGKCEIEVPKLRWHGKDRMVACHFPTQTNSTNR